MGTINPLTGLYMIKPTGGRGKRAPYETTHIRVPVPIKWKVEKLIDDYRAEVIDGKPPENPSSIPTISIVPPSLEDALIYADQLLRAKKSKTEAIKKLLTYIYAEVVTDFPPTDKTS